MKIVYLFRVARKTYRRTLECNILNLVYESALEKHHFSQEQRSENQAKFICLAAKGDTGLAHP